MFQSQVTVAVLERRMYDPGGRVTTQRRADMARIVVVDDDVELAGNLALQLEGKGHKVRQFHKMQGTVDRIAGDPPDLAIVDVMFPDNPAAGFDLARAIRQNARIKSIPIILLTGVNQHFPMDFSSRDIDTYWMPVQEFIEKPVNIDTLLAKINELLG
jgi:DNA-binding response OmpR family regulator